MDQACLYVTCQHQAVLGIENGDELRRQAQGRITACGWCFISSGPLVSSNAT
jgi:hypothetical protein